MTCQHCNKTDFDTAKGCKNPLIQSPAVGDWSCNQTSTTLPCPFCGGTNLSTGNWCLDDEGEVDSIECLDCFAGAPTTSWNKRPC